MKRVLSLTLCFLLILSLGSAAVRGDEADGIHTDRIKTAVEEETGSISPENNTQEEDSAVLPAGETVPEETAKDAESPETDESFFPEEAGAAEPSEEEIRESAEDPAGQEPGPAPGEKVPEDTKAPDAEETAPESSEGREADPAADGETNGSADAPEVAPASDPDVEPDAEETAPETELLPLTEEEEQVWVEAAYASEHRKPLVWWEGSANRREIRLFWRGSEKFAKEAEKVDHYKILFYCDRGASGSTVEYLWYYYPQSGQLSGNDAQLDSEEDLGKSLYGSSPEQVEVYYSLKPFAAAEAYNTSAEYYFEVTGYYTDGTYNWSETYPVSYSDLIAGIKTFDGTTETRQKTASPGVTLECWYDTILTAVPSFQWQKAESLFGPWSNITGATGISYKVRDEDAGFYLRMCLYLQGYDGFLNTTPHQVHTGVPLDAAHFPDDAFRNRLKAYDTENPQDFLTTSEIGNITEIDFSGSSILSIRGIEYLACLTSADLSENSISSADLSGLIHLVDVDLSRNQLTSLNVSDCGNLERLSLKDNMGTIQQLDLSGNPKLEYLDLTSDLSIDSIVGELDLRNNPDLRNAVLYGTVKDEYGNTKIPGTPGYSNHDNSYFSHNGVEVRLNDGAGRDLTVLIANFNAACFPDPGFRTMIKSLVHDSNGILDLSEAQGLSALDYGDSYNYPDIVSLKGIEFLPQLERITGYEEWGLAFADLSRNRELAYLDLGGNSGMTALYLDENTGLEYLNLTGCSLNSIRLSQHRRLEEVYLGYNKLKSIQLVSSGSSRMKKLNLKNNQLSGTLDLTKQTLLEEVEVQKNQLTELDLSASPKIKKLYCYGNDIEKLYIYNNPRLIDAYTSHVSETGNDGGTPYVSYSVVSDTGEDYELRVDPDTVVITEPDAVNKITLNRDYLEVPAKKTYQLKAALDPAVSKTVHWTSENPDVAAVSSTGLVKGKKYGITNVTAEVDGLTADCKVIVLFSDVTNHGKSYFDPVYWAVNEGITRCTVTFRPEDPVSRGEFVAFLYRYAESPKVTKYVTKFTDVKSDTKFYKEISWAVNEGIIKGFSDKTFRPEDTLTREQCAIMIWRYAGRPEPSSLVSPFSDIKPSGADSFKAILWGAENGIIKGAKGRFLPKDLCTRANVVTFLYRYCFNVDLPE